MLRNLNEMMNSYPSSISSSSIIASRPGRGSIVPLLFMVEGSGSTEPSCKS